MLGKLASSRRSPRPRSRAESNIDKQCSVCGKCFERRDTLRRHLQIHDQNRPPPRRRKRACIPCIKSKVKCLAERPTCSRCSNRGMQCTYAHDAQSEVLSPADSSTSGTRAMQALGLFPTNVFASQLAGLDMDMSATFGVDHVLSPVDWLFPVTTDNAAFAESMSLGMLSQSAGHTLQVEDNLSTLNVADPPHQSVFISDSHITPPISRRRTPQPDDQEVPEDRWPMKWHAAPVQLSDLPPFGDGNDDVVYPNHFTIPRLSEPAIAGLREYLRTPMNSSPWKPASLEQFPTQEQLDHCIDLYFTNFDKFLPIIHRPTFDPAKDVCLTLAMAAIGACYSGTHGAHAFATSLCELVRRLLLFMAEHDPRFVRTEFYVTAQLLQSIHGFSSGSKRLYELSDSMRCSIVINARCMGLFEPRRPRPFERIDDTTSSVRHWESWIRAERRRRLAWAVFAFDASSTMCRNSRPLVSLTEMVRMELPCSADRWEAESHQAWTALHPWADYGPPNRSFKNTMDSLFEQNGETVNLALTKVMDDDHRLIMLTVLARSVYDARESAYETCAEALPSYSSIHQSVNRLLSVIDEFARPPPGRSSLYSMSPQALNALVQQTQLRWIAYVLATDDVCDYLHFIWAGSYRAAEAQEVLLRWSQRNPSMVRMVAYAAAQLFSITRQYPCNYPWDPYYIFHSGLFLWSVASVLFPTTSSSPTSMSGSPSQDRTSRRSVCQLDWLGGDETPEGQNIQEWLQQGGNHILRMRGIPDLGTQLGMQQLLQETASVLRRMQVWGIAQNFLNAVLRVLQQSERPAAAAPANA